MLFKNKYGIIGLSLILIIIALIIINLLINIKRNNDLNNKVYPIATTSGITMCDTPVDTTHYSLNTLKKGVLTSQANSFFDDSLLIGDSVTLGFQNYCKDQLGNLKIYGIVSYGIAHSLRPLNEDSLHPLYEGNHIQVWNLVKKLKAKKVFLMFGLNDIGIYGVQDSLTNYQTLISAIKEHNPNVKIYVLSLTPVTRDYVGILDNNCIRQFNNYMRGNSEIIGITYIDIASYLMDEDGYLIKDFSSDNKFHLKPYAYDNWINVLRSFASYNL